MKTFSLPRSRFSQSMLASLLLASVMMPDLLPVAQAGSRDKQTLRKLRKQASGLRRTVNQLKSELADTKRQLAAAVPPFMEIVTVGNPGNANDPEDGNVDNYGPGPKKNFGAVAETFQIGKYEVTNAHYVVFLNAVAETDTHGLFDAPMETIARGGIDQFGTSGSFRYAVRAGMGDKPVNWVNFWDACRFCNWLHNGMPSGAQDNRTTEDGAYTLASTNPDSSTVSRNAGAKFHLPTEDQWCKAAYQDPRSEAEGGPHDDDHYWLYATMSNSPPDTPIVNAIGEITNDSANLANYFFTADWDSNGDEAPENGNVTTVGSGGLGSASFYGAYDMAGNLEEWNETEIVVNLSVNRGAWGARFNTVLEFMDSGDRSFEDPGFHDQFYGFRVASP